MAHLAEHESLPNQFYEFSLLNQEEHNMARFANTPALARRAPTSLGPQPKAAFTFEFGQGYKPDDAHVELFNAAVNGFLTDRFYESGDERIQRLIAVVPKCDPDWLLNFIPWLRTEAYLRSAPVVLAAEYARAGFPNGRQVVASALQRADEPGELLGYWFARYGRSLPAAVKRGIADATTRLYTQRALLRYDGLSKGWRFGDVIEVVHPKALTPSQNALFKFALDRRRHQPVPDQELLGSVFATLALETVPQALRSTDVLAQALLDEKVVFSWERAAGWLGHALTGADWAALLPSMGYMAIMRNLNNFDQAGMHAAPVIMKLKDPEAIKGSRVMPFRFLTAYKNIEADTYKVALAEAADMALDNLPSFPGKTLIMVDCSGSMFSAVAGGRSRNPLQLMDLAAFFAEAIARRCETPEIVAYGSSTQPMPFRPHISVLRAASSYPSLGGTDTWKSANHHYRGHDRVIILTDEQSMDRDNGRIDVPVITWNLAGYQVHHAAHGSKNRFLVAGMTDTVLQTLPAVIAHGSTGKWPWE